MDSNLNLPPLCPEADGRKSPPSPEFKAPSKRSSIACARRLSRASGTGCGGSIPLEDVLATVPHSDEASLQERLEKVIQLVISSTVRGVSQGLEDDVEGDLDRISALIRQKVINNDTIDKITPILCKGLDTGNGSVVGEQVMRIRNYTKKLEEEADEWKKLVERRKDMVRNAESNAKAALKGDFVIDDDQRFSLTASERNMLKKVSSDQKDAIDQLKSHRSKMKIFSNELIKRAVSSKRQLEKQESFLDHEVILLGKKAKSYAERNSEDNFETDGQN